MAMFKQVERLRKVSEHTLIGGGGEYSDLQEISKQLYKLVNADKIQADGHRLSVNELYSYLHRLMYQRRTKINPLWNSLIVAGYNTIQQTPFMGAVDLYGTSYEDDVLATGYGAYMGLPLLRKAYKPDLTEDEARKVLEDCHRVLLYRDCRTLNSFQLAKVNKDGVDISKPFQLETQWEFKRMLNPDNTE